jgi:NADPH-dependent F420 reductase
MAALDGVTVAVLGGTGPQGQGLARRWAEAGLVVLIGSRDAGRAARSAAELATSTGGDVRGLANADAAEAADVAVVAVPYDGHADLLGSLAGPLQGKIVVDCVNPLGFDQQGAYALEVADGSAAQEAAALLPGSVVVAAFHHVSAALLNDPEVSSIDTDVLVLGESEHRDATDLVRALAEVIPGMRGVYAGRLRNAHQVEALTANLIAVNRRYHANAGLRVTDI